MDAVALAALAGASFGALAVAVRWGLRRCAEPEAGALVAVTLGALASVVAAAPSARGVELAELWPFLAAGLIAPGASQICLTGAVRHAGPARAAIFMGTAPLISILIALALLGESFHPLVVAGTVLIVLGSVVLAGERATGAHSSRLRGSVLALICAALFAARDNILRWATLDEHPPPLVAASTSLFAGAALIVVYLTLARRDGFPTNLPRAVVAFAPAGLALALGYGTLLAALDRGRVSIVSPLNATGSLWAVLLAALVIGRCEGIGRRAIIAAVLVVAGGALIGAIR